MLIWAIFGTQTFEFQTHPPPLLKCIPDPTSSSPCEMSLSGINHRYFVRCSGAHDHPKLGMYWKGRGPEGVPEAVRQAGCHSGWGRLLLVTNGVGAGSCGQGEIGWAIGQGPGVGG